MQRKAAASVVLTSGPGQENRNILRTSVCLKYSKINSVLSISCIQCQVFCEITMERFKGQNYDKLRKHHSDMGVPWTDPTFPASDTSIGHSKSSKIPRNVKWLRPSVSHYILQLVKINF